MTRPLPFATVFGEHGVDGDHPGALDNSPDVITADGVTGVVLDMVAVVIGLADGMDVFAPALIQNMKVLQDANPDQTIYPFTIPWRVAVYSCGVCKGSPADAGAIVHGNSG